MRISHGSENFEFRSCVTSAQHLVSPNPSRVYVFISGYANTENVFYCLTVTNLPVTFGKIVSLSQQLVLWVDTYNFVGMRSVKYKKNAQKSSSICRRSTKSRSFSLDRPLLYFSCVAFWACNLDTFRISPHFKGEELLGCFANFLVIFLCIWEEIIFLKKGVKFGEIIKKYLRFDVV